MTFAEKEKIRQDTIKYMEKTFDIEGKYNVLVNDEGVVRIDFSQSKGFVRRDGQPMVSSTPCLI